MDGLENEEIMCILIKKTNMTGDNLPYKQTSSNTIGYKVLRKNSKNKYETPIRGLNVSDNIIKGKAYLEPLKSESTLLNSVSPYFLIGDGFIHIYKQLEDAEKEYTLKEGSDKFEIFKVKIPQGTRYLIGEQLNGTICYASEKVQFFGADNKKIFNKKEKKWQDFKSTK